MWADNETTDDLLGFKVHADLLIDVVNDEKILPVTIGVFGDWGSGKSSILKIVHASLSGKDEDEIKNDTLVLYFNGWLFEGYDDAKAALLESIVEKFEKHKTLGNKIQDESKKLLKSVKWMRALGLGFKNIVLPSAAAYFTGGISLVPYLLQEFSKVNPSDLAAKLSGKQGEEFLTDLVKKQENEDSTLVREFRDDFKKMIDKSNIKKLVVIIDDLDRCTPDRIIENLEAIKLFLNVDKTAFIIGADPRIVRHAIEFRYRKENKVDLESNDRIVDDYLEKLIQIPYNLPKLSDSEVETYISLLVCQRDLSKDVFEKVMLAFQVFRERDRFSVYGLAGIRNALDTAEQQQISESLTRLPALVPVITQVLYGNPRQIKRFLNKLTLRQRLASVAKLSGFNDSVLVKLMVLEYSEPQLFKQLYDWQIQHKGLPPHLKQLESIVQGANGNNEIAKVELEKTDNLKNWGRERVINWIAIEPSLQVDLSDYFWLSRDKIASTIPASSLIPPVIKSIYQKLDQENLSDAVSKKIIQQDVSTLSTAEKTIFLSFCSQMLIRNTKRKRCYDIFQLLIDEKFEAVEGIFVDSLNSISTTDIPPAVGVSLKRYESTLGISEFLEKLSKSTGSIGKEARRKKE